MIMKWFLVFLCCCSLSSQSNNVTEIDVSIEEDLYKLFSKEILNTHHQMSQLAAKHPEVYLESQKWQAHLELVDKPETNSVAEFEGATNLTIPPKVIYNSRPKYNQCQMDLKYTAKSLKNLWVIKMLDSFGKPASGLLDGQVRWPGSYDECLNVTAPIHQYSPQGFTGRYAWLSFNIPSNTTFPMASVVAALQIGVCLPSSCAVDNEFSDYYQHVITLLEKIPFVNTIVRKLPYPKVKFVPETETLDSASKACISICGIVLSLVIVGTIVDVLKRKKLIGQCPLGESSPQTNAKKLDEGEPSAEMMNNSINVSTEQDLQANGDDVNLIIETPKNSSVQKISGLAIDFFLCFSAITNGMAIMDTSTGQGQLQCLHGIRFLSMAWVMLGHTYVFGIAPIGNMKILLDLIKTWPFQVVMQASVSVDTFFLLSGCLLTYLFLKAENQLKSVPQWIMFYVHRYVRLTPVYAMMMFVFATWWNSLGNGPFWILDNKDVCAKSWWWNLLYINNFVSVKKMCMGWSWYLANDMQFYVISPLFLIAIRRNRKLGLALVGILLFASWLATGVLSRVRHWTIMFNIQDTNTTMTEDQQMALFGELYEMPYTRIGPYLIGVLLGYILIETKGQKSFINKGLVLLCWVGSQCVSLSILYGMIHASFGPITTSAYNALTRSAWGISVAWVIFACLTGHAGPVDTILSWKIFVPLSRLTYCSYLVHPMVMYWYYNSMRTMIFLSNSTIVINYLAFVVLSYGVAFIASILFEAPVIKLEKLLRKKS